jgi:Sec-independent protein translocase protein TatA
MFGIGIGELLVVLVIGLFLFGGHLPGIARSLGSTVAGLGREFRGLEDDVRLAEP